MNGAIRSLIGASNDRTHRATRRMRIGLYSSDEDEAKGQDKKS